jgi:hypothetical protein
MVSSDFGKLEVMRHLSSGEDCAIAGEATAVAAAPAAETFKKSRRFIKTSPCRGIFHGTEKRARRHAIPRIQPKMLGAGISMEAAQAKRDIGMTALYKSRMWLHAAAITPFS